MYTQAIRELIARQEDDPVTAALDALADEGGASNRYAKEIADLRRPRGRRWSRRCGWHGRGRAGGRARTDSIRGLAVVARGEVWWTVIDDLPAHLLARVDNGLRLVLSL